MEENTLLVFAKYPQAGSVKTRLARYVGGECAAGLYRVCAETVLFRLKQGPYRIAVFFEPPDEESQMRQWFGRGVSLYPQKGNDLGERMHNAFKEVFRKGSRKAVLIGTDSPLLDIGTVKAAFTRLEDVPCVLGPAFDGGYYLIGLRRTMAGLFKNIPWSTPLVLNRTVCAARRLKVPLSFLETLADIDTPADLLLLADQIHALKETGSEEMARLNAWLIKLTEQTASVAYPGEGPAVFVKKRRV